MFSPSLGIKKNRKAIDKDFKTFVFDVPIVHTEGNKLSKELCKQNSFEILTMVNNLNILKSLNLFIQRQL